MKTSTIKILRYIPVFLLLISQYIFCNCEKPVYEEEKETAQDSSDKGNDTEGDNGGWENDPNNNTGGTDWQDTDTMSVNDFYSTESDKAVWVKGYIVGCATSSNGYKYELAPPFSYETAILLADKTDETNYGHTMAIQLKSGSKTRKELNLVSNPHNYGKRVVVFGVKEKYLKLPGMKTIYSYSLLP